MAKVGRVLVVEDKPEEIGDVLAHLESRFEVLRAESLPEARASLARRPDAILLDVRLQAAAPSRTSPTSNSF